LKKETKNELLFFILITGLLALGSFYKYYLDNSIEVLIEKKGVFNSYAYIGRGYRSKPFLSVNIENEKYNIPSYIHAAVDLEKIKKELKRGDTVTYKFDSHKSLLQIKKGNQFYIDENERAFRDNRNGKIALIVGVISMFFAILFTLRLIR